MAVTIKIDNKITDYIDGATGKRLSYEEFQRKYNKNGNIVGNIGGHQKQESGEGEAEKN